MNKKELIKLLKEITVVMNRSKATFFVKDENTEIDTDEALYELKEEMITNVELHFLKLIDGLQRDKYHICDQCGATAKEVNWKEYKQIKKKYNLYG